MIKFFDQGRSIRAKMLLLITVLISLITGIEIYLGVIISNTNSTQSKTRSEVILQSFDSNIRANIGNIEDISFYLSNNDSVQKFLFESTHKQKIQLLNFVDTAMLSAMKANNNVVCILLTDGEDILYSLNNPDNEINIKIEIFKNVSKFYRLARESTRNDFCFWYNENSMVNLHAENIFPLGGAGADGYMLMSFYNLKTLNDMLNFQMENGAILKMSDADDVVIYSTDKIVGGKFNNAESRTSYNGQTYYVFNKHNELMEWDLHYMANIGQINKLPNYVYLAVLLVVLLTIVLFIYIYLILIKDITNSIVLLENDISKISNGDMSYRIEKITSNEIGRIAVKINSMLDSISNLNREKARMNQKLLNIEIEQKKAEIAFYQTQITPHFLYNILEDIRSIAIIKGVAEIATLAVSTGNLYRYSVTTKDITTLKNELSCIKSYSTIYTFKSNNDSVLEIDIDDCLLGTNLPKMTLQPIIENCFKHGNSYRSDFRIKVTAHEDGDNICVKISDNGLGMPPEKLSKIQADLNDSTAVGGGSGIGLLNVNHRLKLIYNADCGISISSTPDCGTAVTLCCAKSPSGAAAK